MESNKFQLVWPLLWDLSRLFYDLPQPSTGLIPALLRRLLLLLALLFALILFANFSCVFFCIVFPPHNLHPSLSFWIQQLAFTSPFFFSLPFISLFKISSNKDPPSTYQHLKTQGHKKQFIYFTSLVISDIYFQILARIKTSSMHQKSQVCSKHTTNQTTLRHFRKMIFLNIMLKQQTNIQSPDYRALCTLQKVSFIPKHSSISYEQFVRRYVWGAVVGQKYPK